MSYIIDVVVPAVPADDTAAWDFSETLRGRYFDDDRPVSPQLLALHAALTARYPCLSSYGPDDDDIDSCAWSDGPLINNFSSDMVALGLSGGPQREAVRDFVIHSAHTLGLTVFDPQAGSVSRPPRAATWQVAIHGVLAGHDPAQVLVKLGALVRQDPQQLRALLATPGTVVKRGLDGATAEKYRAALVGIGCDCRIASVERPAAGAAPRDPWQVLETQAQAGDGDAQFRLGMSYAEKTDNAERNALAASWLQQAAEQGHVMAATVLAERYCAGLGVMRNYAIALHWARIAAEGGSRKAQYLLGRMLYRGEGTRPDLPEAAIWLMRAAEQDDAEAQYMVGYQYLLERNPQMAALWLGRAAEHGEPNAQDCLGVMTLRGEGVARDPLRGMTLLLKAASQGIVTAQYNLAMALLEGDGIAADPRQALVWFRKAADHGHAASEFQLAPAIARTQACR